MKQYLQSIEQGIGHGLKSRIAGHELTDVRVILCDGSHHEDDSNANRIRDRWVDGNGRSGASIQLVLLEPVIVLQIVVPQRLAEPVMADLRSRRAEITGIENDAKNSTMHALFALRTLLESETHRNGREVGNGNSRTRIMFPPEWC